jgi:spore coat protein CotF
MLSDKDMCTDMLNTEKYISGTYDTAIFEFKNPQIRDVLNHIQKEEQKHGEGIFAYMQAKGMYTAQ